MELTDGEDKCFNGGIWKPEYKKCLCKGGYTGPQCKKPIDNHNQCFNGGTWISKEEGCRCKAGYMGPKCETLYFEGI